MIQFRFLPLVALPLVAACGGTTTGGSPADMAYADLYNETLDLRADYPNGHPITGSAAVNAITGTATYDGTAVIAAPQASLIGDARVGVNFNTNVINGTLDNFYGLMNGSTTATAFSGNLGMAGDFNTARAQDIRTAISGNLTGGGHTVSVNGVMHGDFLNGTSALQPAEALRANLGEGGSIVVNGTAHVVPIGGSAALGVSVLAED